MSASKNIFLIEDDEDDQFFFIEALRGIKNAALFDIANNGKEALVKLQNRDALPDLIFMDINMPVMGGIECLEKLRETPRTSGIPVVILSGDTKQLDMLRELGAQAFLKKPQDGTVLQEKLQKMINLDFMSDGHMANQTLLTAL